ncbi:MAG: hypothetical protein A2Y15_01960 [Clostridiales bacterium GWF2_36_10]|nr:MAG: hypothetical protein A2Y15_01960 [Clostridiales bacterium GWF2_36_10]
MARAAGEMAGGKELKYVRNVIWAVPVAVSEKGQEIEIGLYPSEKEDGIQYEIRSYLDGNQVIHSQGKLEYSSTSSLQVKSKGSINIEEIIGRLEKRADKEGIYKQFSQLGLNYGKTFQVIRELYGNETESLSRLELSEEVTGLEKLILHPSIMDGALQSTIGIGEWVGTYLPFTMKELEIIKPTEETCYVHARLMVTNSSEIKKYNIDIYDKAGELLVGIKEFVAKSVDLTQMKVERKKADAELVETEGDYYKTVWESCNIGPNEENNEKGSIIIFDREDGLYKEYKKHNPEGHVVLIKTGEKYEQLSDDIYGIDENEYSDYQKVAEIIKEKNVKRIIHMWNYNDKEILLTNQKQLTEELNTGIYSIFQLSKAMLAAKLKEGIKLLYISHESKESIQPYNSAISGFIKTIKQENPKYDYHSIRIDKKDIIAEELYEITRNEFHNGKESEVKYENNKRLIRKIIPLPIVQSSNHPIIQNNAVILITGGMGGLGLIFAKYLSEKYKAKLILTGRSAIDEKKETLLKEIRALGGDAIYIQADVTDVDSLKQGIEQAKQQLAAHHGPISINGVIHSAGIIKDDFIIKKDFSVFKEVISPKIQGTINLYEATKEENLEFIVFFSSISASLGNMGQSDYAFANAFMNDSVVWFTNQSSNTCQIMSVGWPLWREGGMQIDEEAEKMLMRTLGMKVLATDPGINAFEEMITCSEQHVVIMPGDREKIYQVLGIANNIAKKEDKKENIDKTQSHSKQIEEKVQFELKSIFVEVLKINIEEIDIGTDMSEYGVDSIMIIQILNKIEEKYGTTMQPSAIMENPTINDLSHHLIDNGIAIDLTEYKENTDKNIIGRDNRNVSLPIKSKRKRFVQPNNPTTQLLSNSIAVISVSGLFPGARNIEEYWGNLIEGKSSITEVPSERFDISKFYSKDKKLEHMSYSKWGGFIDEVDYFDAEFFGIKEIDAIGMDPQHRILLELTQDLLDRAGYQKNEIKGDRTGVYIGGAESPYISMFRDQFNNDQMKHIIVNQIQNMMAARISDYYDLHGPSLTMDTACSSSLVAIHNACQGIISGEVDSAIAGGIYLMLNEEPFIGFSKASVLSDDNKSYVFDERANGFVLGEGAGLVLLKSLDKAKEDGDQILGIIKGSAVNNDGNTMGLTTPNMEGQKKVIKDAIEKSMINPEDISYLEAHGTGTLLGDPIEIKAATQIYREYTEGVGYCTVGSVKSNIGHTMRAAGIASFIKVVLMLQYKQIPATLNCNKPHPRFKFDESPFYPNNVLKNWDTSNKLRIAGISSFGFGGTNCHMLIEEFDDIAEHYTPKRNHNNGTTLNKQRYWVGKDIIRLKHSQMEKNSDQEIDLILMKLINEELSEHEAEGLL